MAARFSLEHALDKLTQEGRLLNSDEWGPGGCNNIVTDFPATWYSVFASKWRGVSLVPAEDEIQAAWARVLIARPEMDLPPAERAIAERKRALKDRMDGDDSRLLREVVIALLAEINALRQRDAAIKATVAAATNFADLKARIAALPVLPPRTKEQVRDAIRAAVDAG